MSERIQEPFCPEGLVSARQVGWISPEKLPWIDSDEHDDKVGLSEVNFDTGTVYIASAGTAAMNKVTSKVRENTEIGREKGKTDELFMRAARMVAGGSDTKKTPLITTLFGASSLLFDGFRVEAMHESPRPNTRRIYYARAILGLLNPEITVRDCYPEEAAQVMVRLAITDKKHQLRLLSLISDRSRAHMRHDRAGSV